MNGLGAATQLETLVLYDRFLILLLLVSEGRGAGSRVLDRVLGILAERRLMTPTMYRVLTK